MARSRAQKVQNVREVSSAIGQELRSQYVIGYVPTGRVADVGFRHVSVGVLDPGAGVARTRAGYYANLFAQRRGIVRESTVDRCVRVRAHTVRGYTPSVRDLRERRPLWVAANECR